MHEPVEWPVDPGPRLDPARVVGAVRAALRGPTDDTWDPPAWLLPHQGTAARRLAGALAVFRTALLADAVGLGKTYVALAVATRYRAVAITAPAALRRQWHAAAREAGVVATIVSHEALSRGVRLPDVDLIVVDEAHRFRNPATRRYDRLARDTKGAAMLFVTATPVVNGAGDLLALLRLALADGSLTALGIPSLDGHGDVTPAALMHAILPLTVARTPRAVRLHERMPIPTDGTVHRIPTVGPDRLPVLLGALARLRFPPLDRGHHALLHQHLLRRLASSPDALAASLRRHRRYLEQAGQAASRGERLARGAAAALLREEHVGQFELALAGAYTTRVSTKALDAEKRRVERALGFLAQDDVDPKRDALVTALRRAGTRKTIVFTTARATALAIGRTLGWRRVAVATGTGARIASGTVPLHEALARFAPHGQRGGPVPPALEVDILVATDLASEGLNLQDAATVVHYDLPWNPLRLAQRLGRTVRLGGLHQEVEVWWFAPPECIEHRLDVLGRIARKAALQMVLPVPTTSLVGRARQVSTILELREAQVEAAGAPAWGYAVVRGPVRPIGVFRWTGDGGTVREAAVLDGQCSNGTFIPDSRDLVPTGARVRADQRAALGRALHDRACRTTSVRLSPTARGLARQVLHHARHAGVARDREGLRLLDAVLIRLREGIAVGAERELAELLRGPLLPMLARWLLDHPKRHPSLRAPLLETLLIGDGRGVAGEGGTC